MKQYQPDATTNEKTFLKLFLKPIFKKIFTVT